MQVPNDWSVLFVRRYRTQLGEVLQVNNLWNNMCWPSMAQIKRFSRTPDSMQLLQMVIVATVVMVVAAHVATSAAMFF